MDAIDPLGRSAGPLLLPQARHGRLDPLAAALQLDHARPHRGQGLRPGRALGQLAGGEGRLLQLDGHRLDGPGLGQDLLDGAQRGGRAARAGRPRVAERAGQGQQERRHGLGLTGLLLGGSLLTACQPEPADATLYHEALTRAPDYLAARAACDGIREVDARGDCRVAAIERFGISQVGECASLRDASPRSAIWQDECTFVIAERLREEGKVEESLAACEKSRFARNCALHLVQDQAQASLAESPAEAEARTQTLAAARPIPDAADQFWRHRFRVAARDGVPPDEALCAALRAPEPCLRAFDRHVVELLEARHRQRGAAACPGTPLDPASLELGVQPGPRLLQLVGSWVERRCGPAPPERP